jgi:hypothetical protein
MEVRVYAICLELSSNMTISDGNSNPQTTVTAFFQIITTVAERGDSVVRHLWLQEM